VDHQTALAKYKAAPARIHDFFRNFEWLNTANGTRYGEPSIIELPPRRKVDLAVTAYKALDNLDPGNTSFEPPLIPQLADELPDPSLPFDETGWYAIFSNQWWATYYGFPEIRERYRPPRSYWTGAPRRRRNRP
jgi:hypothetical protein